MAHEEILHGGMNTVVRSGNTVRRPTGAWTPAVHALLGHVTASGFTGVPRVYGVDGDGREILEFIPGEVAHYPVPGYARTDAVLRGAAELLRSYHDATADFAPPADAVWRLPAREPAEVICHGDPATYNCVFREGIPVAFIDVDTAHPGPRIWDAAYSAYRFVPLHAPGADEGWIPVGEQVRRLRLFAAAYGFADGECAALAATAAERVEWSAAFMHERAAAGETAFAGHIAAGHHLRYRADAAHIRERIAPRAGSGRLRRAGGNSR